jgi:hypothetical protein
MYVHVRYLFVRLVSQLPSLLLFKFLSLKLRLRVVVGGSCKLRETVFPTCRFFSLLLVNLDLEP